MSIDFSQAPEGATHYSASGEFYKIGNDVMLYYDHDGRWSCSLMYADPTHLKELPAPTFEPFVSAEDAPSTSSKHDSVNSPAHYASGGVECIEAIKASMSQEAFLGYLKGNVQKYMWRYEKKANPSEDLKKARWYLDRLIVEQE